MTKPFVLLLGTLLGASAPLACTPAAPDASPAGGAGGSADSGGSGGTNGTGGTGGHHHVPDASITGGAGGSDASDDAGAPDPSDPGTGVEDAGDPAMAMSVTDPAMLAIAGQLQGAFLELDCASEEIELQYCHPKDKGIQNLTFKFGGQAGQMYSVVLRVWGVVEGVKYMGGMPGGEHFYVGGKGGTPGIAEYGLVVGAQTYYLNHFEQDAGEHYTYGVSYQTVPILIPGQSVLGLYVHDPDDFINTNHMDSTAANPSPGLLVHVAKIKSQPLQGQYVYIEIASAVPASSP